MIITKDNILKDTKETLAAQLLEDFRVLCQSHDWYFRYSDDHKVFLKGTAEREEITRAARELRELGYNLEADEILKEYI